jgi:RNA polymerase sigma-70 factor (sigma-E family)
VRGVRDAEFERFFARHHRELSRLADRLADDGSTDVGDLVGDTVLAAWRQWPRIRSLDHPLAYVRRMMRNLAATRVRRRIRERRSLGLLAPDPAGAGPDPVTVVAVRAALATVPTGRRACVLLRFGYDLPEREVAALLGVEIGTVKSQTARGLAQLAAALDTPTRRRTRPTGGTAA